MNWKRKSLAVGFFLALIAGLIANGGIYVTAYNQLVLVAFLAPLSVWGLYTRYALGMPWPLFFRFVPLPFGLMLAAFFISIGLRYEHPFILSGFVAALSGACITALGINANTKTVAVFHRPSSWALISLLIFALAIPIAIVLWSIKSVELNHFWAPINIGIALAAFGAIFCVLDPNKTLLDRLQGASLNAVLLLTGFMVYEYFVGLERAEFAEWTAILTAQNVYTLVIAFALYFASVFASCCYNQISELPTRHWHLAETFLFFVFMVIAPESINEIDADQMTQDDLDQVTEQSGR